MKFAIIWPALAFFLPLLIYIITLTPTISSAGDSGELVAVVATNGVAHPPGYPLYVLLARFFIFFPFGNIAWRLNLLAALFESASILLIFLTLKKILEDKFVALVSSLILAFSYTFWLYGLIAEVFSLNNFFTVLSLYFFISWYKEKNESKAVRFFYFFLATFLIGLSFHFIMLLLAPSFLFLSLRNLGKLNPFFRKIAVVSLISIVFGVLSYSPLLLASKNKSPIAWVYPKNAREIWEFVNRQDYARDFKLGPITIKIWKR